MIVGGYRGGRGGGKKADLVAIRVFSLTRSSAAAFVVSFRVLSPVNMTCFVLELVSLRGENNFKPRHKTGSWYLLAVLFKISDEQPPSFLYGSPPRGGRGLDNGDSLGPGNHSLPSKLTKEINQTHRRGPSLSKTDIVRTCPNCPSWRGVLLLQG